MNKQIRYLLDTIGNVFIALVFAFFTKLVNDPFVRVWDPWCILQIEQIWNVLNNQVAALKTFQN